MVWLSVKLLQSWRTDRSGNAMIKGAVAIEEAIIGKEQSIDVITNLKSMPISF
jgi:hypothetical protein